MSMTIGIPQRLIHLPVVMDVLRRIGVLEVIDRAIREDPRAKVSTSECVAVMLCSVYAGAHDLWRVRERLGRFDLATVMRDSGFRIEEFPEERLARALDDLWSFGVDKLMTSIALQAIEQFQLKTDFLHFDTTSLSFFGAYEREDFGSMGPEMPPAPKIAHGYSKDHRPDLKQVLFGSLVSADGGVPLAGRALDGNQSDHVSSAEFFAEVRRLVADPREVCGVADSKGWCSRVLSVVHDQGMRLLSRLPRTYALHQEILALPWAATGSLTIGTGKDADELTWMGVDRVDVFAREIEPATSDRLAKTENVTFPVRILRVRSTALARTKLKTAQREQTREIAQAERIAAKIRAEAYACTRDAEHAIILLRERHRFTSIELHLNVARHDGPVQPRRGRPRKHPRPPINADHHFRITVDIAKLDEATMRQRLIDASSYLLIRTRNDGWHFDDIDMIRRYKRPLLGSHQRII
jgi:hypothetical protein